ncbi:MAG: ABC transporter substrate-binding protein [Rhodoferax sp.]|nr:ABC transporter substrate-binding protein [Rhodoferax sp.]
MSDKEVLLGQSVGLTGPLVELAPDIINAAKTYFDQVNEKGGVHGREIRTVVLDDGYQAVNTQKTVR